MAQYTGARYENNIAVAFCYHITLYIGEVMSQELYGHDAIAILWVWNAEWVEISGAKIYCVIQIKPNQFV